MILTDIADLVTQFSDVEVAVNEAGLKVRLYEPELVEVSVVAVDQFPACFL